MWIYHHEDGIRWRDPARLKRDILHLENALIESPKNPLLVLPLADRLAMRGELFEALQYYRMHSGLEEDAAGLRKACRPGCECLVASSFSKNFGLYSERVGALTLTAADEDAAQRAFSHLKLCIRRNYCIGSNATPDNNCLAEAEPRAWTSPIFIEQPGESRQ